ncbi:MAG: DPP IV N-terminal domain-containing protein [Crocinitomicaceae bacterium]
MTKLLSGFLMLFIAFNLQAQKTELTLKNAVMQQYRGYYPERTLMFKWIEGTNNYSYLSSDYQTLMKGSIKSKEGEAIFTTTDIEKITGEKAPYINVMKWINPNEFYTKIGSKYYRMNVSKKEGQVVNKVKGEVENEKFNTFSEDLAYTIDNNIYTSNKKRTILQITSEEKSIVSGQAIARSEFGITEGLFWSPKGDRLAFYQKDESQVGDYPLLDINATPGILKSIKYPMAGQKSEQSKVGITSYGKTFYVSPTGNAEDYLTNFGWSPDGSQFFIAEVNRDQNHVKLNQYSAKDGELIRTILEEKNDKWTEPEFPVYFINDTEFIWMSEKDGFMNMYLYNSTTGEFARQLTNNKWVITEILGHDDKGNVFFQGTGVNPTESHAFSINVKSGKQKQLTTGGTHSVKFNHDFSYYFDSHSSTSIPNIESIKDAKGKTVKTLLTAKNPLDKLIIGTADFGTIKAADKKTNLHYRLIKPSNFDETKKYPVLVYVYGGPHAQLVKNAWYGGASLWMYWLAEQGYLVYTLDNRGSANRGFEFESVIHQRLGTNEMNDQLEGVKFLKSLKYVDSKRLAVHGWSFGGFMTNSLMLRHPGTFTTGVAGGPVTDWKYYEIMYGERYMDRPEQNEAGYKESSLMNYVKDLEGNLLLIHGTADNVVVMQHNLSLVKAFIEAEKQIDFFPYPMHEHNVRGKDRVHLMTKILNYVIDNNK